MSGEGRPRSRVREQVGHAVTIAVAVAAAVGAGLVAPVRADEPRPVTASSPSPTLSVPAPRALPPADPGRRALGGVSTGTLGGWWVGAVGVILALAVVGGLSLVGRRLRPAPDVAIPALQVVGRASLSPRHAVYLLRAGDRVLVVGAGPQGPPALLGELTGREEPSRAQADDDPATTAPETVAIAPPAAAPRRGIGGVP